VSDIERNKLVVVDYYQTAFNGDPEKAVADHFGPRYIQHNPDAADGPEAFIGFVHWLRGEYPNLKLDIKRVPVKRGGRNGVQSSRGWASLSATSHSTAGWWPKPMWLARTSTFSASGDGWSRQARQATTPWRAPAAGRNRLPEAGPTVRYAGRRSGGTDAGRCSAGGVRAGSGSRA
jgi:hypothetical protein